MHLIPFREQELSEVRAILSGDTCDQRFRHYVLAGGLHDAGPGPTLRSCITIRAVSSRSPVSNANSFCCRSYHSIVRRKPSRNGVVAVNPNARSARETSSERRG